MCSGRNYKMRFFVYGDVIMHPMNIGHVREILHLRLFISDRVKFVKSFAVFLSVF